MGYSVSIELGSKDTVKRVYEALDKAGVVDDLAREGQRLAMCEDIAYPPKLATGLLGVNATYVSRVSIGVLAYIAVTLAKSSDRYPELYFNDEPSPIKVFKEGDSLDPAAIYVTDRGILTPAHFKFKDKLLDLLSLDSYQNSKSYVESITSKLMLQKNIRA